MQNYTHKQQTHLMLTCWIGIFQSHLSFNDAVPKNKEELIQAVSAAYDNILKKS